MNSVTKNSKLTQDEIITQYETHFNQLCRNDTGLRQIIDTQREALEEHLSNVPGADRELMYRLFANNIDSLARRRSRSAPIKKYFPKTFKTVGKRETLKSVKKSVDAHNSKVRKQMKRDRESDRSQYPKYDFNSQHGEWVKLALSDNPPKHLQEELVGHVNDMIPTMPQTEVVEIICDFNVSRVRDSCAQYPLTAIAKDINVNDTVTISTGQIGSIYLMYLTIMYDIYAAMNGEFTIFAEAPMLYWHWRNALGPRELKDFAYSFNTQARPTFEEELASGIPLSAPRNGKSMSWPTGTENAFGQAELVNTIPSVTIEDIQTIGVEVTTKIWARLGAASDKAYDLHEWIETPSSHSAEAFTQTQDQGAEAYEGFARCTLEVPIKERYLWLSAMDYVNGNDRRGYHIRVIFLGTAQFGYRILSDDTSNCFYEIQPCQLPVTAFQNWMVAQLIQMDVIKYDLPSNGPIQQPQGSVLSDLQGSEVLYYMLAILSKRFMISSTILAGSPLMNDGTWMLGGGREGHVDYSVLNMTLPISITEGLAETTQFVAPIGGNRKAVYLPYVSMTGDVYVDGCSLQGNDVVDDTVMVMYPDVVVSGYTFSSSVRLPPFFSPNLQHTSHFEGSGPLAARSQVSGVLLKNQGFMDVGPGLANVHDQLFTNLHYTKVVIRPSAGPSFDNTMTLQVDCISNTVPFSANEVSHHLSRILPITYVETVEEAQAYFALRRQSVSIKVDESYAVAILPAAMGVVHPVAGWGYEQTISDHASIEQHKGGGFAEFLKGAGQIGLPLLGKLVGSFADTYAPGSGALISGLGSQLGEMVGGLKSSNSQGVDRLVASVLRNSYKNPHAPLLKPISSIQRVSLDVPSI